MLYQAGIWLQLDISSWNVVVSSRNVVVSDRNVDAVNGNAATGKKVAVGSENVVVIIEMQL